MQLSAVALTYHSDEMREAELLAIQWHRSSDQSSNTIHFYNVKCQQ